MSFEKANLPYIYKDFTWFYSFRIIPRIPHHNTYTGVRFCLRAT